ncbi:hypothetical protein B5G52_05670 [Pseudoalteromonas sp. A601]|uniref:hypothetical protein n=1 Tax=Pseudoalteromonas sp. A601 TaxID=1967839 RepID=UPI000B3C1DFD|nr:hypothetical protein [Pseudoalteromonas sp. A601]OUS73188.1 hypothetical protein B5G52_05670 [Pseudoalteromonas sp. A601]
MKSKQNYLLIILIALSALFIWLTKSFIVFNDEVQGIAFADLIRSFTELNIIKIMSFPEFWATNKNYTMFDALNYMFEPMTALSGVASFILILSFSHFVSPLKPASISLSLLLIGFLYIIVAWSVLLDVQETKMVGAFLSIGVQGLLIHAIIIRI